MALGFISDQKNRTLGYKAAVASGRCLSLLTLPQVGAPCQHRRRPLALRPVSGGGLLLAIGIGRLMTKARPFLGIASLALACTPGCGGDGGDANIASAVGGQSGASRPSSTMHADLVAAVTPPANSLVEKPVAASSASEPKVIYLVYADGTTPLPDMAYNACSGLAPKFDCTFAPTLNDCQQQIQAYLDRWYADFNVIFTLTKPTSGSYYTEVVSSGGGAWCGVDSNVAGVAPFLCTDLHGGVAYTLDGGANAHDTAVIIAQEQAHLLGLEHVSDANDIMYPYICQSCDGFENVAVPVAADRCDRDTQNSYQMMMTALGAWGGGPKPSAFGCMDDTEPPSLAFLSPTNEQKMGHDFSVKVSAHDDCQLSHVAIAVAPQGLTAMATSGPYEWDLTGIDGKQTITVTAVDGSGHQTVATLDIIAPPSGAAEDPTAGGAAGCTVATGAFGAAGLLPSLAMLLLWSGRARRAPRRPRIVPGALAEATRMRLDQE
jgi:Big-like domain-containing protein